MDASPQWRRLRNRDFHRALAKGPGHGGVAQDDVGEGYLYRPGELLLGGAAVDELRSETRSARVRPDDEVNARFARHGVDLQRWVVPPAIEVAPLQRALEGRVRARGSHVELNHVFTGEWVYEGGPATEPVVAGQLPAPQPLGLPAAVAHLAVLDTGVTAPPDSFFAAVLLDEDGTDVDVLDEDHNLVLDTEAGHGTFICGLVQRVFPGLTLQQRRVLTPSGFGDDLTVALGVAESTAPVINLSLGGYTRRNRPPRALELALDALDPSRVVVAAAGNNARTRPFWPAAFAGVVAVAAYDGADDTPAPFSNHGPWVDVCAPGVALHSCYVDGRRSTQDDDVPFHGWATWSGTSFAAPLVAAEIAHRVATGSGITAAQAAADLLVELGPLPSDGYGRRYAPAADLREPPIASPVAAAR